MNHFRWQNVFDHSMMCIMDYNHFGVGLTLIDEGKRKKRFLQFHSQ